MPRNSVFSFQRPKNESVFSYAPGSPEKAELKAKMKEVENDIVEIPLIIGGKEVITDNFGEIRIPHNHKKVIARYHKAGKREIDMAIQASKEAKHEWERMPWDLRALVFKKAAALIAGPYRAWMNAVTMLGQSKNCYQSEIDAVCELVDFLHFNSHFMGEIYKEKPESTRDVVNMLEYRPLEGFVFALTPFNFTSIGGNLPTAPAMLGNVVLWKPASTAVYSGYVFMKILEEAGLPSGVINFIPGTGSQIGKFVFDDPDFAGIHFTGSSAVFNEIWETIGNNISKYKSYPRIVGETGGKDFIMVHNSADCDELITAIVRGAYEYQGQKCSAASRAYIPQSIWDKIKDKLAQEVKNIKVGTPDDFTNFVNAVIDQNAYNDITSYIDYAKVSTDAEIIAGGTYDSSEGYYIDPTLIVTTDPSFKTMEEEIFGPVMTVYVYSDDEYEKTLELCDKTSPYALTGCIIARDRGAQQKALDILTHAAGNFYINDKPTAAVVGQQPFGGSRGSGTNDKAGSAWNLMRWISPRTIKETLVPPKCYGYPFMKEK